MVSLHPETIAALNDAFLRSPFPPLGRLVVTAGISAFNRAVHLDIIGRVRAFAEFTPENDPWGEHDFGAFDHPDAGKIFWKIDAYDPTCRFTSEDAADPARTRRVLTIMLASEY